MPDFELRHMGQCSKSPPHEGCGTKFVVVLYAAFDHPERTHHPREAQAGRTRRDDPGGGPGSRLAAPPELDRLTEDST
jgi:hypothetical protein